jgi:anaerobic selenocysteine-containing dehydrogenase
MQADGKAWLFAPAGLVDGLLPAHYEPQDSPFANLLYGQNRNPVRQVAAFRHPANRMQPSGDEPGAGVFPYVATTYRLTEHHTAGGMSRWLPYLSELQPEFFCEVSPRLAAERGLEHLGWATIVTARNAIEARVLVTERMKPLTVLRYAGPPPGASPSTGPATRTTRTPSCPAATPPAPRKKPWTAPAACTSATPPPGSPVTPGELTNGGARPLELSRVRGICRQ